MLSNSNYLQWNDRPSLVNSEISTRFERLSRQMSSDWPLYNGMDQYGMCGIKEHHLMKMIIQKAYPQQKEFYAVDLGSGNFQWVDALSYFIDNQPDLPQDIRVHVIGVRGESYDQFKNKTLQTDRCILYKLGSFKIEELFKAFQEKGLFLKDKVDLVVSHWCFCHLVDPVATFAQAVHLVGRERFFIGTGFLYSIGEQAQLLIDTKAPFLFKNGDLTVIDTAFILQRPNNDPIELPLQYTGELSPAGPYRKKAAELRRTLDNRCRTMRIPGSSSRFYGDRQLFSFFKEAHPSLWVSARFDSYTWQPIRDEDCEQGFSPLHKAVISGDAELVRQYLQAGHDIDEYEDANEDTPLHLAIQAKQKEIFEDLLNRGACLKYSNLKGLTPLHVAASLDTDGFFLRSLIERGAKVNKRIRNQTPMRCAIKANNNKAIEILQEYGVPFRKSKGQVPQIETPN